MTTKTELIIRLNSTGDTNFQYNESDIDVLNYVIIEIISHK